jgi:DNA adenine methylase
MPGRSVTSTSLARPFLKWAGGKSQLLAQLESFFPPHLESGEINRYVEPFIGSGAVFFHLAQTYPVETFAIADVNPELILAYCTVQRDVNSLIESLAEIGGRYLRLGETERRNFYYAVRERFNSQSSAIDRLQFSAAWVERTSMLIFLNRTGYNGLFRLNSRGEFNVPFGRYRNPRLLDERNLRAVAGLLQGVQIRFSDFEAIEEWVDPNTLVYFDPPYRPISGTAHFTSYSKEGFDEGQQLRLAAFYHRLDKTGARLMLSNSDPRGNDPEDDFFERAYAGYRIERLSAKRNINSVANKRGPITELLILNY